MDLGGALLNHDCDPNVVIVFNSTQVQVRALRKLKAGEELVHCYRDIAYDFTFRNPRITSRYQFRCHCKSLTCPAAPFWTLSFKRGEIGMLIARNRREMQGRV